MSAVLYGSRLAGCWEFGEVFIYEKAGVFWLKLTIPAPEACIRILNSPPPSPEVSSWTFKLALPNSEVSSWTFKLALPDSEVSSWTFKLALPNSGVSSWTFKLALPNSEVGIWISAVAFPTSGTQHGELPKQSAALVVVFSEQRRRAPFAKTLHPQVSTSPVSAKSLRLKPRITFGSAAPRLS